MLSAVAFVVAVSALIALRDAGYLGGRAKDGPLRVRIDAAGAGTARLRGGPVRIQNVRVRVASPRLSIAGPNLVASARPLEDATLRAARTPLQMRLRAFRPGVFYAVGLVTDYRRGQRRFRELSGRVLCVAVGRRRRCDPGYRGPGRARVAQVGGPSRYPGARLTDRSATYTRPAVYPIRLTLLNRTRSLIAVRDLALDRNPSAAVSGPRPFKLGPQGSRSVRLFLTVRSCAPQRFGRLRARLDGERRTIPLSLPLRVACP